MKHLTAAVLLVFLLVTAGAVPASAQSDSDNDIYLPMVVGSGAAAGSVHAAGTASDLFFSEYVEGSSLNKAVEIYNATGSTVDLGAGNFSLALYFNGSPSVGTTVNLTGSVADGDVYVVADDGAVGAILGQTDQAPTSSFFNGDDAVALLKNGAVIDVIGQIGFDPGSQWGSGLASTADNTLRRKPTVCAGDANGSDAFDPSIEWDGFAKDTFDDLGIHTADCGSTPPVVCPDAIPVADVQGPGNDTPLAGQEVSIRGLVTADFGDEIFVQEAAGGPRSGVLIYSAGNGISRGDEVCVTGIASERYNQTQIGGNGSPGAAIELLASGIALPAPALIDAAAVNDEQWEGVLVRVDNVTVTNPNLGNGEWEVSDGSGVVLVDDLGTFAYVPAAGDPLGFVQGPLYFSFSNYKIEPRDDADIGITPLSVDLVINELHADPAGDISGDANGDGRRDGVQDEFVEIYNSTGEPFDLSGWTLADGNSVRHTFPAGALVPDQCAIVVFGGGAPSGPFGGALLQTASGGSLGLNNGGDTVTISDGAISVVAEYGSEGGDNQSLTLEPDAIGPAFVKHSVAVGSNGALFSPGTAVDGSTFAGCNVPPAAVKIHEVQGSGSASPLVGRTVIIEGVVVGDFQDGDADTTRNLRGYYVQEEDDETDGNPSTSEGVFVFDRDTILDVNVGDVVQVTGVVGEFFGETQLSATAVTLSGSGAATPATIDLPTAVATLNFDGKYIADLEYVEGMLVTFADTLSVTELYNLDRFGEMRLSESGRLVQYTSNNLPDVAGYAQHLQDIARRNVMVDDGISIQNPDPIIYPAPALSTANAMRMGDTISNLTGVVRFSRGSGGSGDETYRIMPTETPVFVSVNPRTAAPADVGGSLKVASFNVLNFFTTIDDGNNGARGADSVAEYDRQRDKLVTALVALDADIVGLVELENNYGAGAASAIATLTAELNARIGSAAYAYVDPGVAQVGDDAIAVGFIYKVAAAGLAPGTTVESLDDADLADLGLAVYAPLFNGIATNRVPLAATFETPNGARLTLAVNHFKSKGSSGLSDTADPNYDQGDGQGFWNLRRTQAAEALHAWLATDPTASGDADFLIIGDLNAYAREAPVAKLAELGYVNLFDQFGIATPYSYVFDGQVGTLDYGLAAPTLAAQATGVSEWHVNADEADALDYNLDFGRSPALFDGSVAYRNSDHDPLLIGLSLTAPPVCAEVVASPSTIWPPNNKMVQVTLSGVTDPDGSAVSIATTGVLQDEPVGNSPDAEGLGSATTMVRAERDGNGDGRIYEIQFTATDGQGESCSGHALVTVPKSQGKNGAAQDSGVRFDSTLQE